MKSFFILISFFAEVSVIAGQAGSAIELLSIKGSPDVTDQNAEKVEIPWQQVVGLPRSQVVDNHRYKVEKLATLQDIFKPSEPKQQKERSRPKLPEVKLKFETTTVAQHIETATSAEKEPQELPIIDEEFKERLESKQADLMRKLAVEAAEGEFLPKPQKLETEKLITFRLQPEHQMLSDQPQREERPQPQQQSTPPPSIGSTMKTLIELPLAEISISEPVEVQPQAPLQRQQVIEEIPVVETALLSQPIFTQASIPVAETALISQPLLSQPPLLSGGTSVGTGLLPTSGIGFGSVFPVTGIAELQALAAAAPIYIPKAAIGHVGVVPAAPVVPLAAMPSVATSGYSFPPQAMPFGGMYNDPLLKSRMAGTAVGHMARTGTQSVGEFFRGIGKR